MAARGRGKGNMIAPAPEGPPTRLNTILETTPDNPSGDPHGRAHHAGEAAGKVIGGGLGVVIGFVLLLLTFGPILWAPLWAAVLAGTRIGAVAHNAWLATGAGLLAAAIVAFLQFLLLVQKSPLLRYPAVLAFSLAWTAGLWWELTAPPHDWLLPPPAPAMPGPWVLAGIGAATVVYAGLYLLMLTRFGKGRWARRWQLIR
ncbi:MAG: hypothetical protein J7521_12710 [Caulobacter sp.]|nr:hypothetical protein [Caulobacter sp.]